MKLKKGQVWRKRGKYKDIIEIVNIKDGKVKYLVNRISQGQAHIKYITNYIKQAGHKLELLETFKNLKDINHD